MKNRRGFYLQEH
jgi:hypothetical protein